MTQINIEIGQIFNSNNYGEFKILSFNKDKNNKKTYDVLFLKTNNKYLNRRKEDILKGRITDIIEEEENFIMKIYPQKCGDSLKIIRKTNEQSLSKNYLYECEFIEYPFKLKTQKINILKGNVINYNKPSICDFGYLGVGKYNYKNFIRLYNLWHNAIHRCYNLKQINYKTYGDKGVKVCDEWANFQNFAKWGEDFISKYQLGNELILSLDKDILCNIFKKQKIYSPETCLIIPYDLNAFLAGDSLKSGVQQRKNGNFQANICLGNKCIYLGTFSSFEEAKQIYAEEKYKYWKYLIERFKINDSLKEILLKYNFNWK